MHRVLLIQPPMVDFYRTAKRTIPCGLAAIAAALRAEGFDAAILDAMATDRSRVFPELPETFSHLAPFYGRPDTGPFALFHRLRRFGYSDQWIETQIRRSGAFLVGVSSLFTAYADEALAVARLAKKALPRATVVMGGHHATAFAGAVLEDPAVDFVIRGEGELAMTALARALLHGAPIDAVPGIAFRLPSGRIHQSAPAVIADLDRLPLPAMDLVDRKYYRRKKQGATVVMTSRGCPMTCSYCCMGRASPFSYRRRGVEAVLGEMERAVVGQGVRFIDFEDENLSLDREWFSRLLEGIQKRFTGFSLELRAMNGLYPPSLDTEVLGQMRRAGFTALNLALATTSALQLERFRRPDVTNALRRVVAQGAGLGFSMVVYVIAGAPGQDPLDSVTDLLFLADQPVVAGLSVFYPAPFSPDHEGLARRGLLPPAFDRYRATALPVPDTTTRLQMVTLMRLSRLVNFIKRTRALGMPAPKAAPLAVTAFSPDADPFETGGRLVSAFLKDGRMRGIAPDGTCYEHLLDPSLVAAFLSRFDPERVLAAPVG